MALLSLYSAGMLATLLAALQLAGWLAVGQAIVRDDDGAAAPVALLLGHALCAALTAGLAAAGLLGPAIALPAALCLAALAWRRRAVWRAARALGARLGELAWPRAGEAPRAKAQAPPLPGRPLGIAAPPSPRVPRPASLALLIPLAYWLVALAPPRDADVLRYHLAHVRQILQDGAWLPIADYHYALPFGWSLTYLPFEAAGLPVAAHMLNLGLLAAALATLFALLRRYADAPLARLLALAFAGHTAVLHMGTTARADMHLVFVVLAAAALLLRLAEGGPFGPRQAAMLGFAAWVGAQSRYQAVALGLAVSAVALRYALRRGLGARAAAAYLGGAAAAAALAAPFYLFNWAGLGNPVWPLLIERLNQPPAYADLVAQAYSGSLNGALAPATLLGGLGRLLVSPVAFPVPIAALLLLPAALRWRGEPTAAMALLAGAFLALWAVAQPRLYPRFSLMLLVPSLLGWAPLLARWWRAGPPLRPLVRVGLAAPLALFGGLNLVYAYDYLAYAVTGDAGRFHAHTWFKPTYDWFNAATAGDARPLVVVTSAQSYYLERAHRRGDPRFAGVVDWAAVGDSAALAEAMARGGFTHLIYEAADWSRLPGGRQMMGAVAGAVADGTLRELARFDERLSTSRLLREGRSATVIVYELAARPGPAGATTLGRPYVPSSSSGAFFAHSATCIASVSHL